ncbi:unnamed protein product [Heterobilharzia americana]|nr:unnamed protein product [Heterobilharzia americana]
MMTHQPVKVVVEEIDSNYESYLACLKERNRQRELLKRKTEEDLEKERLEKGFQLYFNAATKYLKSTSRDSGVSRFNKRNRSAPNLPKQKNKRKSWGDVILPCSEILVSEQVQSSASSQCSPKTVNCPNLLLKATTSRSCKSNQSVPQLSYFLNDDHTSSLCNTNAFNYCRQEIHINGSKVGRHIKENFHKIDLIFDIFDNWGDRSWVGLNGFEVIVNDKNSVHIYPHTVNVCRMNSSHSSDNTLSSVQDTKLFKSSFTTTTLEDMWLTSLENLPIRINFSCMLNHNYLKGSLSLNIWNFANSNLPGVGVRKCLLSVIFEGMSAVLYDGILPKVSETSIENSITSIFLNIDDILHPEGIHTVTNSPENNSSEYLESSQTSHSDDTDTCHSNNNNNDSSTLKQDTSSKLNVWFPSSHLNKLRQDDENDLLSNVNEDLLNYSLKRIHMKRITNGREHMNTLLEESWSSLNFFNHFHEGRISLRNESYRKNNFHSDISEYSSNPMIDSSSISDCSEFSKVESGHLTLNSSSYLVSYEVEKQDDNNSTAYYPSRIDTKDTLIPELPSGHNLLIDIISTWGDLYYVGLTGIEIFTSEGVNIASFCGITANPSDINTLPGYGTDPRVVTNLIDGVNWTRDDTHMWLTPFTLGQRHFVEIKFPQWIKSPVALIRIWNYNKSRVHSYRGVKDMIIYLDNQPIFYGEISKASGLEFGEPEDFCETILFCTDNEILDLIGKNDILLKLAENDHANGICLDIDGEEGCNKRPVTGVSLSEVEKPNINIEVPNKSFLHTEFSELTITDNQSDFCKICFIEIVLLEPWVYGSKYIGLTVLSS